MGGYNCMINWKAKYNDIEYSSGNYEWWRWEELPLDGLLWVWIYNDEYTHILQGGDYYWIYENKFGMIFDGSCCEAGEVSWKIQDGIFMKNDDLCETERHLIEGLMVSDDEWKNISKLI